MFQNCFSFRAFAIHASTGAVTVAAALDYETTKSYTLTITATDSGAGSLTDTATLNVQITGKVPSYRAAYCYIVACSTIDFEG